MLHLYIYYNRNSFGFIDEPFARLGNQARLGKRSIFLPGNAEVWGVGASFFRPFGQKDRFDRIDLYSFALPVSLLVGSRPPHPSSAAVIVPAVGRNRNNNHPVRRNENNIYIIIIVVEENDDDAIIAAQ